MLIFEIIIFNWVPTESSSQMLSTTVNFINSAAANYSNQKSSNKKNTQVSSRLVNKYKLYGSTNNSTNKNTFW